MDNLQNNEILNNDNISSGTLPNKKVNKGKAYNQSKKKRIISTTLALVSSAVLLTTATYAWFKLTNTPTANGLTMKAGAVGSLMIANPKSDASGPDTYSNNISFTFSGLGEGETVCLRPLTTVDAKTFYTPVYNNEGIVSEISANPINSDYNSTYVNKSEKNGAYLIKKEFYLKASSTDTSRANVVGIKLLSGGNDGTHIWNTSNSGDADKAIRVSLTYGSNTVVLEPNYDKDATNTDNSNINNGSLNSGIKVIKQSGDSDYKFLMSDNNTKNNKSEELFKIPLNTDCKITMYVWIEGSDKDCTEYISSQDISSQLQFICDELG